jgi:hypothetical protein
MWIIDSPSGDDMTRSIASSTPTFLRRQLGSRLRQHRIAAGKSVLDVDASRIVSDSTLWRIEAGVTSTKPGVVKELCDLYEVDAKIRASLVTMARASASTDGWFEQYGDAVPSGLELYLGAEQAASSIRVYDTEVIFGILQTPEYAAALFRGEHPAESSARIETLVKARMERQQQFWKHRPSDAVLCVVLSEAALAREVGGRETMTRQVDQLRELCGQPENEVDVRFLPWSRGGHPAIYGGFTIFDFPEPEDHPVVYMESYTGGKYFPGSDAGRALAAWERVFDLSVPIEEHLS